jgi:hypothetical protein
MNAISKTTRQPSPYQIERAMSAAQALRASLTADDPAAAEDSALLADLIDGETPALDIVRALIRFGIEAQSLADATKARIDDLRARKERFERRVETARGTAFAMLEALEIGRLEEPDFTAAISKGRPGVRIIDANLLPGCMTRTKIEPDKLAIKAALDAGKTVNGAELSNGSPTLTVRTK